MHTEYLVKMANDIAAFFHSQSGPDAPRDIAGHIKRYWDPRMRRQMLKYYEERGGAGLSDLGKRAVALLHAASQAPAASTAAAAAAGATVAPKGPRA